jgi:hypothetical protein
MRHPDRSIECQDGLLCNLLSITCFMRFHIKATFERCCPRFRMVALCLHIIAITGPRPDGVALSFRRCCPVFRIDVECMHTISLSRISASGRYCTDVRTGASCLPNPCLQRRAGIFSNSEEPPDMLP